jgi:hypothetical protein
MPIQTQERSDLREVIASLHGITSHPEGVVVGVGVRVGEGEAVTSGDMVFAKT